MGQRERAAVAKAPWWKGARGEWLVAVQLALLALVFFGPRGIPGRPGWALPFPGACRVIGAVFMILGGGLLLAGIAWLRRGLTPLPYPRENAALVETGPYALVRHPMYCGGIVLALGWALWVQSGLTLGYAAALFVFADFKSRREERWLTEKYPAYEDYRRRVRKLVPFVY